MSASSFGAFAVFFVPPWYAGPLTFPPCLGPSSTRASAAGISSAWCLPFLGLTEAGSPNTANVTAASLSQTYALRLSIQVTSLVVFPSSCASSAARLAHWSASAFPVAILHWSQPAAWRPLLPWCALIFTPRGGGGRAPPSALLIRP